MKANILDLLDDSSNTLLLVTEDLSLSRKDFSDLVDGYADYLSGIVKRGASVLVREENPAFFYPLVFALWRVECVVIFPNRDIISSTLNFLHHEYAVQVFEGRLHLEKNNNHSPLLEGIKGDTIVFSSGSTGKPKGIVHQKESFLLNAREVSELIQFNSCGTLTPLKPYLVSAFSHFLLHYLTDSYLHFIDNDRIECLAEHYQKNPDLAFVGSPMHIISGQKHIPKSASPSAFMSSGDFIYPNTIQKILENFPRAIYYSVYGLAEFGGRFFVNKINHGTPVEKYTCLGKSLSSMIFFVEDREIFVDSPYKFLGYLKDGRYTESSSYHASGDLIDESNNCSRLLGRKDREIKVSGNKVSLENLEQRASSVFPGKTVVFLPVKHESLGTLIAVIIESSTKYSRKEVIVRLRKVLGVYEVPHYIYILDQIPYTQSSKVDRESLRLKLPSLPVVL